MEGLKSLCFRGDDNDCIMRGPQNMSNAHRRFLFRSLSASRCPHSNTKVVEALMCMVSDEVSQKKVSYKADSDLVTKIVPGEASCRHSTPADWRTLADHHCLLNADESEGAGKVCARLLDLHERI